MSGPINGARTAGRRYQMQLREVMAWGLKSVGGLVLNLALLTVWVDYVGLAAELAIFPNWLLISLLGYVFTDRVVFPSAESPVGWIAKGRRYIGMQSVMALSKALNYGIYVVLLWVNVEYRIAWVIGAVVTFSISFLGNRRLWTRSIKSGDA